MDLVVTVVFMSPGLIFVLVGLVLAIWPVLCGNYFRTRMVAMRQTADSLIDANEQLGATDPIEKYASTCRFLGIAFVVCGGLTAGLLLLVASK